MTGEKLKMISELHNSYVGLTGLAVKLNVYRTEVWARWCEEGFEPGDLRLVVKFLKDKIRTGERRDASLRYDLLIAPDRISGFSRFEEDLAMARKVFRVRSDKPVDKVVATPEGPVHFQDFESTAPPARIDLTLLGESIKNLKQ